MIKVHISQGDVNNLMDGLAVDVEKILEAFYLSVELRERL